MAPGTALPKELSCDGLPSKEETTIASKIFPCSLTPLSLGPWPQRLTAPEKSWSVKTFSNLNRSPALSSAAGGDWAVGRAADSLEADALSVEGPAGLVGRVGSWPVTCIEK